MEYAFDYYQYDYCITLYLNDRYGHAKCFFNRQRNYPSLFSSREASCIAYDKTKTRILAWGNKAQELREKGGRDDIIYKDNFMEEMGRVYPKYKEDPNDKDALEVLQSVTDFILNLVNSLKATWTDIVGQENTNAINLHFVFIVPTEWEFEIREDMLRPIFISTGLISKTDHPNRLLLFTQLESVIQLIQHPKFNIAEKIKASTQYIMCNAIQIENGSIIKFDAFEFEHCGIGLSSTSTLVPRVSKSVTLEIDLNKVKTRLKEFIREIGIPQDNISDGGIESIIKRFLSMQIESDRKNARNKTIYPFKKVDQNEWRELSLSQLNAIKSITLAKIHEVAFESIVTDLESGIQEVLSYNFSKIRSLISIKEALYDGLTAFPSLFEWISIVLHNIGRHFNYNVLVFTDNREFLKLRSASIIEGASRKMLEKIKISDAILPPNVIRRDTLEGDSTLSILHKDDPDIVITIDISFRNILYSCVLMNGHNIKEIIRSSFSLSLPPLANFFEAPNINVPTTLKVEKRIIAFLEEHLDAALQYFTKYDRRLEKKKFNNLATKQKMKHYVKIAYRKAHICKLECCKRVQHKENIYETHEIFSHMSQVRLRQKTKDLLGNKECSKKTKLQTQQRKYIKAFIVMYFGYLNQLIKDQLVECIENKNKSISYVLLLEKRLLRSIIGTKKELKELLIASDLFQKEVKTKKLKIITHGEGILPALQYELGLNLALKSYYVLSQLHTTYIQVTLYQVVQTKEIDEEASAIVIQNETLPIENIYDSLCKHMWTNAELDKNLIQCCTLHPEGFSYSKNYKYFITKVKAFIFKKFSPNNLNLNCVDEKETIQLSKECKCRIDLSIRDILDISFRPIISDIINTISSTLVNGVIFGKYDIENQFILGNFFQLSYDSPLHKKMTSMIQEELDDAIENKELWARSFALLKSIDQLLQPKIGNRHSLHEVFHNGCLHQVSRENYGLDFYTKRSQKGITVSYKDSIMENTVDAGNISVILRRGQLIESEEFTRIFSIHSKHLSYGENIQIRLLRFSHLKETSNDDIISLSSVSCDVVQKFSLKRNSNGATIHVVIKMKPKNHFSSLNFTAKMIGEDNSKTTGTFVYVGEQLTVAYF